MPVKKDAWPPGTPAWVDLTAADFEGAKAFYAALFGWDYDESDEEYGHYATATLNGESVAGIGPAQGPDAPPPSWTTYLAVDDAAATVEAASAAGATVLAPVIEIGPMGSMAILADPTAATPFSNKVPTKGEVEYARFASRTPHVVLSTTLPDVTWANSRIVRHIEAIRALKAEPGKDMHAVGGATLVSSLINAALVDELRLVVQPILLGGGKPLFKDVTGRHPLRLVAHESVSPSEVRLTYAV